MGYGLAGHVGLVLENSLAVLAGARTDFIKIQNESLVLNTERIEVVHVHGAYFEPHDEAGIRRVEGDITFFGHAESMGHFLAGALGVSSSQEVTSGYLYRHTFTPRTAANGEKDIRRFNDSFSLEVYRHDVASAFHYLGCLINKFSMNLQPNQELRCTASILGISASIGSKSTPTFPGSPTGPFMWSQASLSIGGAAVNYVEGLTIDFDNQGEAHGTIKLGDEPHKIKRGPAQLIRISGTNAFENLAFQDYYEEQTEFSLDLNITRANSFGIRIQIPWCLLTSKPVNIPGRDRITYSWEAIGRTYSGSAGLIVDLWNTRSGYLV